MNEQEVKAVIKKVYKDLKIDHNDKYPIKCRFFSKAEEDNTQNIDFWSGCYDYSKNIEGEEPVHLPVMIRIDDKNAVPFSVLIFPGECSIEVTEKGNYKWRQ